MFFLLTAIAGIFSLYGAMLPAVSQLIVYVGGILILLLFGIMLSRKSTEEEPTSRLIQLFPALVVCVALLAGGVYALSQIKGNFPAQRMELTQVVEQIGISLLSKHLLLLEALSVLLLAALVAALWISRIAKEKSL